jgi:hypothetical protein
MSEFELTPPSKSTLRRPSAKEIASFRVSIVGDDTVETFLKNGWSLAIFCKHCPRTIEWTPPGLLERFDDRLNLRITDLVPRLSCSGTEGCGSKSVAVGPHLYDGQWTWPLRCDEIVLADVASDDLKTPIR